jgi:hypothetical protein
MPQSGIPQPFDNSGDSIHPVDLGYENMAATVSLAFVRFSA